MSQRFPKTAETDFFDFCRNKITIYVYPSPRPPSEHPGVLSGAATALILPATTLTNYCYDSMFSYCTSLTSAPVLPATKLAGLCYKHMFRDCSQLNYVKCLATDISSINCTDSWLSGVSATGTFVKDPSMTGWTSGESGIPDGWTVN